MANLHRQTVGGMQIRQLQYNPERKLNSIIAPTILAMETPTYDPRYVEGVNFFNECEYFEAHEIWEDLWTEYQGPSRKFYQGLIQVAVCLHHFGNGNTRGAKKLYFSCNKYLAEYPDTFEGIDVAKLRTELEACCAELLASGEEYPKLEIDPELIPEIHLDPAPS